MVNNALELFLHYVCSVRWSRRRSPSPNKLVLPLLNMRRRLSADEDTSRSQKESVHLPPLSCGSSRLVSPANGSPKRPKGRKKSLDFCSIAILPGFMGAKRKSVQIDIKLDHVIPKVSTL